MLKISMKAVTSVKFTAKQVKMYCSQNMKWGCLAKNKQTSSLVSNPTSDLLSGSVVVISLFCFYRFLVVGFLSLFVFSSFFFCFLFLVVIFVCLCFILHQMMIQATTTFINGFSFMPRFICRVLVYSRVFYAKLNRLCGIMVLQLRPTF